MNPVFFQYKPENVLDQLIALFNEKGWNLSETMKNYFHEFRWPDIVLSDKIARLPEPLDKRKDNYPHTIELLGCYQTTCNPLEEGRVVLYMPAIRKTALKYAAEMKITDAEEMNQCIERLTAVILIHEFAHWAVHVGHSPKPASPDCSIKTLPGVEYFDEDNIRYHETCAQIFTNYICSKNEELWPLFLWLSGKQPEQYNKYHELFGKDIASKEKITNEQLTSFIYCLEITRAYNIQNYRFFELFFWKKLELPNLENPERMLIKKDIWPIFNLIFGDEDNIEEIEAVNCISNNKEHLLTLLEIFLKFNSDGSDNSEDFKLKLESAIKDFCPVFYILLKERFHGKSIGKIFNF